MGENLVATVVVRWGGLDLLVNDAGVSMNASVADLDEAVVRALFEIDSFATVALTKLALPELVRARGRIVVISSVAGLVGTPRARPGEDGTLRYQRPATTKVAVSRPVLPLAGS